MALLKVAAYFQPLKQSLNQLKPRCEMIRQMRVSAAIGQREWIVRATEEITIGTLELEGLRLELKT